MSKTLTSAMRSAMIATGVVGDRVYLDFAPINVAMIPYITYNDNVSFSPAQRGDTQTLHYVRDMQINLWEQEDHEDPDLLKALLLIDGVVLDVDGVAFKPKVKVLSCSRLVNNMDDQIVHHEITVSIVNPRGVF